MVKIIGGADFDSDYLIDNIGKYELTTTPIASENTLLYQGISDYTSAEDGQKSQHQLKIEIFKEKHPEFIKACKEKKHPAFNPENTEDPQFFRKAFILFITNKNSFAEREPKNTIEELQNEKVKKVKAEEFLGQEGLHLYQLALEEEMKSQEFRNSVLAESTLKFPGPKLDQRHIIFSGGPSASGKTHNVKALIKKLIGKITDNREENTFIQIDGGKVREVSEMRKLLINTAVHLKCDIVDLHSKSKVLQPIKQMIFDYAQATKSNMIIPETFAAFIKLKDRSRRWLQEAIEDENTKVIFSRITGIGDVSTQEYVDFVKNKIASFGSKAVGRIEAKLSKLLNFLESESTETQQTTPQAKSHANPLYLFQSVVRFMGDSRAWFDHNDQEKRDILKRKFDLHIKGDDLCEQKEYGRLGFFTGVLGSKLAEEWFKKNSGSSLCDVNVITNDLILVKRNKNGEWVPTSSQHATAKVSKRTFDEWNSNSQIRAYDEDLDAYARKHPAPPLIKNAAEVLLDRSKENILKKLGDTKDPEFQTIISLLTNTKLEFTKDNVELKNLKLSLSECIGRLDEHGTHPEIKKLLIHMNNVISHVIEPTYKDIDKNIKKYIKDKIEEACHHFCQTEEGKKLLSAARKNNNYALFEEGLKSYTRHELTALFRSYHKDAIKGKSPFISSKLKKSIHEELFEPTTNNFLSHIKERTSEQENLRKLENKANQSLRGSGLTRSGSSTHKEVNSSETNITNTRRPS